MPYNEKINIYVPENIGALLNNDATLFEIFKKDRLTINRNRFLNQLIRGYYGSYVYECHHTINSIEGALTESIPDFNIRRQAAEQILYRTILPEVPKRKGKNPTKLSLKPTNETAGIIQSIIGDLSKDDYVSQYFCRMFMGYSEKPLYEREKLVFQDSYQILSSACVRQIPISFTTIWDMNKVHEVVPYELVIGQDEMFNYLLCQEENSLSGRLEARVYRLNRITRISINPSTITLSDRVKHYLERMKEAGAQYPINDDDKICVKLNDYGTVNYNRIYYGRPKYTQIEHKQNSHYYYFNCSKDQVYLYFRRFDSGSAEIVYPEDLRERMIRFYSTALAAYTLDKVGEKTDEKR